MRTKTLLLAAALSAVGAASSLAQVYSVNSVGYVNLAVTPNLYNLIANPLNGTNNSYNTVLPLADDQIGTTVVRWDSLAQGLDPNSLTYFGSTVGWLDSNGNPPPNLNPGEAIFLLPLTGVGAVSVNITFVGEVPQGTLNNPLAGNGKFNYIASIVPQAAPLGNIGAPNAATLQLPNEIGDLVYLWSPTTTYSSAYTSLGVDGAGVAQWLDVDGTTVNTGPTIPVGTGFVFQQVTSSGSAWTRSFSVNP